MDPDQQSNLAAKYELCASNVLATLYQNGY